MTSTRSSAVSPWDLGAPTAIPVARPRLAPLQAALPYLRTIDDRRTYANFGPLNAALETRLAARFGLPAAAVVTCSNATVGLTLALLSVARAGTLCLVPAWTFAATGHAILAAGLVPFLTDVDPETGALTPELAEEALRASPGAVAAAMPVAPFGLPLPRVAWESFEARTGVPVVLDAAAGFDGLTAGVQPAVVSLHATKILGIGEGGFVLSADPARIRDLRRRTNFGFSGDRNAAVAATNGKISEYAAAVGLAALDLWPLLRAEFTAVLAYYRAALAGAPGVRIAPGLGNSWASSTFNIQTADADAAVRVETALAAEGVATRRWWGAGLQGHGAFEHAPRRPTPVADALGACTVGLPCWPGLPPADIDRIAEVVRAATAGDYAASRTAASPNTSAARSADAANRTCAASTSARSSAAKAA